MENIKAVSKRKKASRLNKVSIPAEIIMNIIIAIFSLICIIPFVFVIIITFTSQESLREIGYSFRPISLSLTAYRYVVNLGELILRAYGNSIFITVVGTILSVLICVLYSYALFRPDYKWRGFFNFLSFFTMLFGGGLAPTYFVCKQMLGLSDNYPAMIVPLLFNPFNIIIMRTFFKTSVPTELIEAAAIDGSGEYNTLFRIITPIAKPGIATIALMNAIAIWNEWYIPMLYIRESKLYPLQYVLIRMQNDIDFLVKNASSLGVEAQRIAANLPKDSLRMVLVVLVVLPIACAYPFFQRYIISGLTIGSVKG